MLCAAGCSTDTAQESSSQTTTSATTEAVSTEAAVGNSINEGELKTGAYSGSSAYSEGEFSMEWNYTVFFNADGAFTLTDKAGEEKGAGTYALTDNCYTMTYSDGRTCTFVVQADGTVKITSDMPYGQASITPDMVGGITLSFIGEAVPEEDEVVDETTSDEAVATGDFSIAAGTYSASYIKESPMAGTVEYKYSADIGADTFSYSVSFDMGGTAYDGCSASGTYTVDGGKFVFTDEAGTITEGTLTADNTLVISLKSSEMAKEPYEVTFTLVDTHAETGFTLNEGTYSASYIKESPMAGTIEYKYSAEIGADTFSYSVSFDMGGTAYDGCSASGTYIVDGGKFVFADESGAVTEGTLTADNTLVISLKASDMAKEPYEVTFVIAE